MLSKFKFMFIYYFGNEAFYQNQTYSLYPNQLKKKRVISISAFVIAFLVTSYLDTTYVSTHSLFIKIFSMIFIMISMMYLLALHSRRADRKCAFNG